MLTSGHLCGVGREGCCGGMIAFFAKCSKCYAIDCCGSYLTDVQTCDNVRVQSGTQWTAAVHS